MVPFPAAVCVAGRKSDTESGTAHGDVVSLQFPPAAEWVGDHLETFQRVCARPEAEDIAGAKLAGYGRKGAQDSARNATRVPQAGRRSSTPCREPTQI